MHDPFFPSIVTDMEYREVLLCYEQNGQVCRLRPFTLPVCWREHSELGSCVLSQRQMLQLLPGGSTLEAVRECNGSTFSHLLERGQNSGFLYSLSRFESWLKVFFKMLCQPQPNTVRRLAVWPMDHKSQPPLGLPETGLLWFGSSPLPGLTV